MRVPLHILMIFMFNSQLVIIIMVRRHTSHLYSSFLHAVEGSHQLVVTRQYTRRVGPSLYC